MDKEWALAPVGVADALVAGGDRRIKLISHREIIPHKRKFANITTEQL